MKREADTSNALQASPQKRHRHGDEELRFLIPSRVAGSIIGRGGQNIAKLRSQYKASITIPDCYGPERILTISADLETVFQILNEIIPKLEEGSQRNSSTEEIDLRMLVHQSQAGSIIGKGGLKIKELREKTGARIKIYSNCCPHSTDRLISICGKPNIVLGCIQQLISTIKSSPIKGISNPYDPRNYDEFFADEYGGYGETSNSKTNSPPIYSGPNIRGNSVNSTSGNLGISRLRESHGNTSPGIGPNRNTFSSSVMRNSRGIGINSINFNNTTEMISGYSDRSFSANNIRHNPLADDFCPERSGSNPNNRTGQIPFPRNFNDSNWNMPIVNSNSNSNNVGNSTMGSFQGTSNNVTNQNSGSRGFSSTQVTIPKDLAGAIIGKGGARIRKIRLDSGAGITIDMPLPGSSDRIITISGIPRQIQMAQFLLQQSVHENADLQYNI